VNRCRFPRSVLNGATDMTTGSAGVSPAGNLELRAAGGTGMGGDGTREEEGRATHENGVCADDPPGGHSAA